LTYRREIEKEGGEVRNPPDVSISLNEEVGGWDGNRRSSLLDSNFSSALAVQKVEVGGGLIAALYTRILPHKRYVSGRDTSPSQERAAVQIDTDKLRRSRSPFFVAAEWFAARRGTLRERKKITSLSIYTAQFSLSFSISFYMSSRSDDAAKRNRFLDQSGQLASSPFFFFVLHF
jgi:hypothetical protein